LYFHRFSPPTTTFSPRLSPFALTRENAEELVITTSDAEPLVISVSRIAKRENMPSSMPPMGTLLTKREIRDVVEFLSGLK
jgi:hypothetical protein